MDAVSQADLDGAVAQYEAALGSLKSARARVAQAEIRLGYTRIRSPIAGRIGISKARFGEFVGRDPNPVVLNFVSHIDPIRVRFSIDERTYLVLARRLRELQAQSGERADMGRGLQLTLADGTIHPHEGRVVAADASVDPKTGTFTFEADFANPDGLVLAGQFARVRAVAETRENAILVPSRAIAELQGSYRVFVIGGDGKVEFRPVELGPQVGNLRIIESGLAPGEQVAVEIIKLQPGMVVKPRKAKIAADGRIDDATPGAAETKADASAGAGAER